MPETVAEREHALPEQVSFDRSRLPTEVTQAVLLFASTCASYSTAGTVTIDGGSCFHDDEVSRRILESAGFTREQSAILSSSRDMF